MRIEPAPSHPSRRPPRSSRRPAPCGPGTRARRRPAAGATRSSPGPMPRPAPADAGAPRRSPRPQRSSRGPWCGPCGRWPRRARSLRHRRDTVDERLVDLQHVDRKLAQAAERRVSRAEVVHRDAHAETLQRIKTLTGSLASLEQRGLGDLQGEVVTVEPGLGEHGRRRRRRGRGSRNCRPDRLTDTERSRSGRAERQARNCRHACHNTFRPSSTMSPVSSARAMNSCGPSSPRSWVLPPHERLEAAHLVGVEARASVGSARRTRRSRARCAARLRCRDASIAARCIVGSRRGSTPCPRPSRGTSQCRRCGAAPRNRRRCRFSAMPMLALTNRCLPATANGVAARRAHAGRARVTSPRSTTSSNRTANSSPPKRDAVSPVRKLPWSRCGDRPRAARRHACGRGCR